MNPAGAMVLAALSAAPQAGAWRQTQADDYTRYELQDPSTQSFRIYYYVTATTPGATYYFNTIRRGAEETARGVYDPVTGEALAWEVVDGRAARAVGMLNADTADRYIKVRLARPVPDRGEARVLIDKTYRDPASVAMRDGRLVFSRSLGVTRNAVVLPAGYELVGVSYPDHPNVLGATPDTSVAYRAGLREGDRILEINDTPIGPSEVVATRYALDTYIANVIAYLRACPEIAIFDAGFSKPNQLFVIGAKAMIGIALAAIANGISAPPTVRHRASSSASRIAAVDPITKPPSASLNVNQPALQSVSRSFQTVSRIVESGGSRKNSTSPSRV